MLIHMNSTPLVCNWRTRPKTSQGMPARKSGLYISMAPIRPIKSAMVSQKMAEKIKFRAALCSAVNSPPLWVMPNCWLMHGLQWLVVGGEW